MPPVRAMACQHRRRHVGKDAVAAVAVQVDQPGEHGADRRAAASTSGRASLAEARSVMRSPCTVSTASAPADRAARRPPQHDHRGPSPTAALADRGPPSAAARGRRGATPGGERRTDHPGPFPSSASLSSGTAARWRARAARHPAAPAARRRRRQPPPSTTRREASTAWVTSRPSASAPTASPIPRGRRRRCPARPPPRPPSDRPPGTRGVGGGDRTGRGERLQAAARPHPQAGRRGASGCGRSRRPGRPPGDQLAPPARPGDPGADHHEQHVVGTSTGAEALLGEAGRGDVVADHHRQAKRPAQVLGDRASRQPRLALNTPTPRSRSTIPARPRRGRRPADHPAHGAQQVAESPATASSTAVRRVPARRGHPAGQHGPVVLGQHLSLDRRAANVDPEDQAPLRAHRAGLPPTDLMRPG